MSNELQNGGASALGFVTFEPPLNPSDGAFLSTTTSNDPISASHQTIMTQTTSSTDPSAEPTSQTVQEVLERLRLESFTANSDLIASQQSKTQTGATYKPHIDRYDDWWAKDQSAKREADPSLPYIPSRPITATKVYMFIEHERTRPKVSMTTWELTWSRADEIDVTR